MNWNTIKDKILTRNVGISFLLGGAVIGLVSSFSGPTRSDRIRTNLLSRSGLRSESVTEQEHSFDLVSQLVDDNFLSWALSHDPEELHEIILHYEDLDNGQVIVYVDDEDHPRLDDLLLGYEEELMDSLDEEDGDDEWVPEIGWDDHLGWTYAADYYPNTDIEVHGRTGNSMAWFKEMQPWHFADIELSPKQIATKESHLFQNVRETQHIQAVTSEFLDARLGETIPDLQKHVQHLTDDEAILIALMEAVEESHPYPELLEADPVWQDLNALVQENADDLLDLVVMLDELSDNLDQGPNDDSHIWTMAAESERYVKAGGRHSIRDLFLGFFVPMQKRYGQEVGKEMREYYETGKVGIHDDEDNTFWQPSDRAPQGEYSGLNRWQARPVAQAVAYAQMADKGYLVSEGE